MIISYYFADVIISYSFSFTIEGNNILLELFVGFCSLNCDAMKSCSFCNYTIRLNRVCKCQISGISADRSHFCVRVRRECIFSTRSRWGVKAHIGNSFLRPGRAHPYTGARKTFIGSILSGRRVTICFLLDLCRRFSGKSRLLRTSSNCNTK